MEIFKGVGRAWHNFLSPPIRASFMSSIGISGEVDVLNEARVKCPRCGGETFEGCHYDGDMGGMLKFLDRYTAACKKCGFVLSANVSGGDVGQSEWDTECPFCGIPYHAHKKR